MSLKDREGSRCGASSRAAAKRRSRSSALRAASRIPRPSRTSTSSALTTALVSASADPYRSRSEEHTSELQSLAYLVCRLLLEKKKQNQGQSPAARAKYTYTPFA